MRTHGLLHHTAVYTVGSIVYRAASFILVPLYVQSLPAAEYGKLELITATVMILSALLSSGIAHATMRFYFEYTDPIRQKAVITTALLTAVVLSGTGAGVCILLAPRLSQLVLGTPAYSTAFSLAALGIVFELAREIALAYIRATQRSALYSAVSLLQLGTQVTASVYAVVHLQGGITGILAANLFATACVASLLVFLTLRECGLTIHSRVLPPLMRYGFPLVITGLSGTVVHNMDRYFANSLVSLQALGTYALGLRVAAVLSVLVNTPFFNSYGPYRFSIMREESAGDVYSRVLTGYTLVCSFIVVSVSLVSREALRVLASPEYLDACRLVPILLLPAAINGITYCLQTGIYVQKRTRTLMYISAGSGAVNLLALLCLGPLLGLPGIACASGLAAVYAACHTYVAAQRLLPVRYDIRRVLRIAGTAAVVIVPSMQLQIDNIWQSLAAKLGIIALYPFLLVLTGAVTAAEVRQLRTLVRALPPKLQLRKAAP